MLRAVQVREYNVRAWQGGDPRGKEDYCGQYISRLYTQTSMVQRCYYSALILLLPRVHVVGLGVGHRHPSPLILVPETAARVGDAVPDGVRDLEV